MSIAIELVLYTSITLRLCQGCALAKLAGSVAQAPDDTIPL